MLDDIEIKFIKGGKAEAFLLFFLKCLEISFFVDIFNSVHYIFASCPYYTLYTLILKFTKI